MFLKMLRKDIQRNKLVNFALFLFVMLAALAVSSAVGIMTELSGALDHLFERSCIPHFTQMHAGAIDQQAIDSFAAEQRELVERYQTAELLNIDGANLFLGNRDQSEADSIQQNAFVRQNKAFGFFLDENNQILKLMDGEAAVPIYHKQEYGLKIGDTVSIQSGTYSKEFTIVSFLRDAQMNSTLSESKRFLISDNDWAALRENIGTMEYLIEFRLFDPSRIGELESSYLNAGLPQKGPSVTYPLYRLLSGMSDGIVAAVMTLVGVLLVMIAILCLRFTIITAMEEDYREIGAMKALGIHHKEIGRLYLTKYMVLAGAASLCGYLLSLFFATVFTANISLYMGEAEKTMSEQLLPILGAVLIFLIVVIFSRSVLKRFKRISAVEAIRTGNSQGSGKAGGKSFTLHKSKLRNVNLFLGLNGMFRDIRVYGLLGFVYLVCSFLMILPLNTLNTIRSPEYITNMGVGKSDMRIDIQRGNMNQQYQDIMEKLERDSTIKQYAGFYTGSYEALTPDGMNGVIRIESGDFSVFPLQYMEGSAPKAENEIALSVMNADEFGKKTGDVLTVTIDGRQQQFRVCGIYQDMTNAGKTAKAKLPLREENVLYYIIYTDLTENTDLSAKVSEYAAAFPGAKVNAVETVVWQIMGNVMKQLEIATRFSVGIALGISGLITAMFFKMLMTKERSQTAIMRSIGFSMMDIRLQYTARGVSVVLIGIVTGTLLAGALGQKLAALLITGMSSIQFVINPFVAWFLCPAIMIAVVSLTLWLVFAPMKKTSGYILSAE